MERLKHYPTLLAAVAICLDIILSVVVAPIIDDIRTQHRNLEAHMKERIERLEAELQGVRVESFQQFETQKMHLSDSEHLLERIKRLEDRTYESHK